MAELKEKIEKRRRTSSPLSLIKKACKKRVKITNTILKDELVWVLERRMDEKFDILNEKQRDLDDIMSTMTQNINTLTKSISTMTQNHNTLIEML